MPGPIITLAPDRQGRYPPAYCTLRAVGMLGPRSRFSLGTALTKRIGREDRPMPGPGELPAQQPARIIGREAGLARLRGLVAPVEVLPGFRTGIQ
jgi:hypothetical protein